jgi:hypothetical protein
MKTPGLHRPGIFMALKIEEFMGILPNKLY